jgi:hypothetical protein
MTRIELIYTDPLISVALVSSLFQLLNSDMLHKCATQQQPNQGISSRLPPIIPTNQKKTNKSGF